MKNEWKIIVLAIICFVLGTSEYVIVGVLDKIAATSHISLAQAGQLISVFAITVAIGTPVAIYLTSRWNQRKTMMLALALVVSSCLLMIASSSYLSFLLSRVVMALGVGVFNVLCFIAATRLAKPERRGRAVATVTLGFNAALIIGLPIGRIVTGLFGWKAIFVFTGSLSLIAILAIYYLVPSFEGEKAGSFRSELQLLKKRAVVLNLVTSFFWILGYSHLYTYITPYLQHTSGMNERMLSITFLVFGIATLIGNKTGGYLGDKIGVSKTTTVSLVVNVCALVLLSLFAGNSYAAFCLLVLWGMAAWTPGPLFRYSVIALAPGSAGIILSLYNSIMQLGMATGAGVGGIEIEHLSTHVLSWTSAGFVAVSLVFALRTSKANTTLAKPVVMASGH